MNFLTADVAIVVDASKLPQQLAKARTAATKTAAAISKSFKKMGQVFKNVFKKMVKVAKWASLAIVAALTLTARAAMKQQDALFLLDAALKISGEYTVALSKRFREFAADIQEATIYGDEFVLSLMQQQKSLGVVASKLEDGARMAIGLATATGQGIESMSRYVALAMQGEFTMLRRYIPALRATTDVTEQLAIVQKFAADGFKLAEERAKTASGGLRQMWNALGDVAEAIGKPLLDPMSNASDAIKKWAKDNQERIGKWSETSVAYIIYVKDILVSLVKYMRGDWVGGLKFSFSVAQIYFVAFGKTMIALAKEIAKSMADVFVSVFGEAFGKWLIELGRPDSFLGRALMIISPITMQAQLNLMKAGIELVEAARKAKPERPSILPDIGNIAGEAREQVMQLAPPELKERFTEAFDKLQESLEAIKQPAEESKEIISEMPNLIKEVVEEVNALSTGWNAVLFTTKQYFIKTTNWGKNLGDILVNALDKTADALAEMAMRGKVDFKAMARSIIKDILAMIIKLQIVKALMSIFPGLAPAPIPVTVVPGVPSGQHGGEITQTGLIKAHKGEWLSGENNEMGFGGITVNNYAGDSIDIEVMDEERVINISRRTSLQSAQTDGAYRRAHNIRSI